MRTLRLSEYVCFVVEVETKTRRFSFFSAFFRSFSSLLLSIKMAADKDKMDVDNGGSPPPATAQTGPAATQVRRRGRCVDGRSMVVKDDVSMTEKLSVSLPFSSLATPLKPFLLSERRHER